MLKNSAAGSASCDAVAWFSKISGTAVSWGRTSFSFTRYSKLLLQMAKPINSYKTKVALQDLYKQIFRSQYQSASPKWLACSWLLDTENLYMRTYLVLSGALGWMSQIPGGTAGKLQWQKMSLSVCLAYLYCPCASILSTTHYFPCSVCILGNHFKDLVK